MCVLFCFFLKFTLCVCVCVCWLAICWPPFHIMAYSSQTAGSLTDLCLFSPCLFVCLPVCLTFWWSVDTYQTKFQNLTYQTSDPRPLHDSSSGGISAACVWSDRSLCFVLFFSRSTETVVPYFSFCFFCCCGCCFFLLPPPPAVRASAWLCWWSNILCPYTRCFMRTQAGMHSHCEPACGE